MKKQFVICLSTLASACILFSGCGSSSKTASSTDSADYSSNNMPYNESDYLSSEYVADTGSASGSSSDYSYNDSSDTESESNDAATSSNDTSITGEKMVYSGNVSLETLEYDKSMSSLKKLIKDNNGIIQSEEESNSNYYWYYDDSRDQDSRNSYITVRIPSEKFDSFLDSLSDLGQVTSKSTSTENITKTYNDNEAQIEALQKEQARLLDMMDKATTIEDMISVEQRLTTVESELNQANTSKAEMDNDVEYSTISINVSEVSKYSEIEKGEQNFGERVLKAIKNSWNALLIFFQGLLIVILYILPFAIIAFIIIFVIVKYRKKHPKAKNGKINSFSADNSKFEPTGSNINKYNNQISNNTNINANINDATEPSDSDKKN